MRALVLAALLLAACVGENPDYDPTYSACVKARSNVGPCGAYLGWAEIPAPGSDLAAPLDMAPGPVDLDPGGDFAHVGSCENVGGYCVNPGECCWTGGPDVTCRNHVCVYF
jgi:hypothetical protein